MKEKTSSKKDRMKRPNFSSEDQRKREEIFETIINDSFLEFMDIKNPEIKTHTSQKNTKKPSGNYFVVKHEHQRQKDILEDVREK